MTLLDGRTAFLLQRINELCADGNYKVVEKEDLISAFPDSHMQGEEGLDGMLTYLQEHEYVDIKYADRERGVYCLYPLPPGRLYAEKIYEKRREEGKNFKKVWLATFFGAFAGALLGTGMVALLAVFLI